MRRFVKKARKERVFLMTPLDMNLVLAILFLNVFGAVMIYSASYYYGPYAYDYTPDFIFKSQIKYVAAGLAAMCAISFIRPRLWRKLWFLYILGAIGLLVSVRIPGLGWASHGAYRWIKLGGFKLQVAEPIKVLLILSLAWFLSKFPVERQESVLLIFGTIIFFALGLLFLSNNLSTAMIVSLMLYLTMAVMHPKPKGFYLLLVAGILFVAAIVFIVDNFIPFSETENFRITRIRAWIHPTDPLYSSDTAYQAQKALYAVASGGLFGKGLGRSLLKFSIPEPHNDYILAVIIEELGIFGVLFLSYLYLYILYRLFRIYKNCRDTFSRVVILGVFFHISLQVVLNYAVTLGLFPTMGVTLPFVSAGGASAFFTLCELGFCLCIDRQNKERDLYMSAEKEVLNDDPEYRDLMSGRRKVAVRREAQTAAASERRRNAR